MNKSNKIVLMGLLIALDVVAAAFLTIKMPFLKIGVSFIPISLTGIIFGPLLGGAGAAMSDILQYFLFNAQFAYIPGITLDAFLAGAVYGLVLYKKKPSILRCFVAALICELIISGLLSTVWLYIAISGQTFTVLLLTRIVKGLIMTPIETITIYGMLKLARRTKGISGYIPTENN